LKANKNKQANTSRFRGRRRTRERKKVWYFRKEILPSCTCYFHTFGPSAWERPGQQMHWFLLGVILKMSVETCENIPIFVKIREHNRHFEW